MLLKLDSRIVLYRVALGIINLLGGLGIAPFGAEIRAAQQRRPTIFGRAELPLRPFYLHRSVLGCLVNFGWRGKAAAPPTFVFWIDPAKVMWKP